MLSLPPSSVDMVFADPPYFLSNGGTTNSGGQRAPVAKGAWDESAGHDRDHAWHARWLRGAQRVLRPSGTIWVTGTRHCIMSIGWAMQRSGWHILNLITWEKPAPPPNLGCRTFTDGTELIIWAAPARHEPLRHVFNYAELRAENGGKQMRDVWRIAPPSKAEKAEGGHPAQKPLALLERCIRASTHPGQVVLDPFMGSGTTIVAAAALGRPAIGCDMDLEWVEKTGRRCKNALQPGTEKR